MPELVLIVYSLSLALLLVFSLYRVVLIYRYFKLAPRDPQLPVVGSELPVVTVQLPVFNEYYVVERLIRAACAIEYPRECLQIQVLDDSTDETRVLAESVVVEMQREGYWIEHIHRSDRVGYKAGALKNGLARAAGEYIAIFDADFMPTKDFLMRTIPHLLSDPHLGMVQARWGYLNERYSMLTRIQAMALDAHFAVEQQANNRADLFINFNGTAGVWRASCITDAGSWQADTLTEDLDLSIRAQLRGWRFLYLNDLAVPSELPSDFSGLKSQQFRWTKGTVQTARKHLGGLFRSNEGGSVKFNAAMRLLCNLAFPLTLLVAVLSPVILLLKTEHPELTLFINITGISLLAFLASFAYTVVAQRDLYTDWRGRMLLFPLSLIGSISLVICNTRAVIEGVFGRVSPFIRTAKYGVLGKERAGNRRHKYRDSKNAVESAAEILLAFYFTASIIIAIVTQEYAVLPSLMLLVIGFGAAGFAPFVKSRSV